MLLLCTARFSISVMPVHESVNVVDIIHRSSRTTRCVLTFSSVFDAFPLEIHNCSVWLRLSQHKKLGSTYQSSFYHILYASLFDPSTQVYQLWFDHLTRETLTWVMVMGTKTLCQSLFSQLQIKY